MLRAALAPTPCHMAPSTKRYMTPAKSCGWCGSGLHVSHEVKASVMSMDGPVSVVHVIKRCCRKECRVHHAYNFLYTSTKKYNTVMIDDVKALFVNVFQGYDLKFLRYHDALHFRGFVSATAVEWACRQVLDNDTMLKTWRRSYEDARFLYLAMVEFSDMKAKGGPDHMSNIQVSDHGHEGVREVTEKMIADYDKWLHHCAFPIDNPTSVKELAGDGHEKILKRICNGDAKPMKTRKAPGGRAKPFTHGWFMVMDPANGRIVSVVQQFEPENNAVCIEALEKVIHIYGNVDAFILDRNCKFAPTASARPKLAQIKTWAIDRFHAHRHSSTCPCNPYSKKAIKKRLQGVNTSVCEQVWSWFRGYAPTFNTMNSKRHRFIVLCYCRRHNDMLSKGDTDHLPRFPASERGKRATTPYTCSNRVLKRPCAREA